MALYAQRGEIGGTGAAPACGIAPYSWSKTQYEYYLEQIGEIEPEDISDKPSVYWGTKHESMVADEYAERTGFTVIESHEYRHTDYPWMVAHPDRMVRATPQARLLECKTADKYMGKYWGEEGTDEIPESYLYQCLHYLYVTGVNRIDCAVLIGGNDFRIYTIERAHHEQGIKDLVAGEIKFMEMVKDLTPPPIVNAADALLAYPEDNGDEVTATAAALDCVQKLAAIKTGIGAQQIVKALLETEIKAHMGEASELVTEDNELIATWRNTKPRMSFDKKKFQAERGDLYKEYCTEGKSSRRFSIKLKGED